MFVLTPRILNSARMRRAAFFFQGWGMFGFDSFELNKVAGAVLGKVVGKDTKGAVIGAVGGAVLGTGAVMAAKGYELDVPAGSKLSLRVDAPISVVAR